jgi:hypothetical protein
MSQGEMVQRLGVQGLLHYTTISKYEFDKNEPPLAILLAYARLAEFQSNESLMTTRTNNLISSSTPIVCTAINFPNTSRRDAHKVDVEFPNKSPPPTNSVTSTPGLFTGKERYRSLRWVSRQGSPLRSDELHELKTVRFALDCLPRCGLRVDKSC